MTQETPQDDADTIICSSNSQPKRHQLRRTKGYKKPDGVRSVTRPGRFGNPFATADEFRKILTQIIDGEPSENVDCGFSDFATMYDIAKSIEHLRGRDVACWCSLDAECHADVLIEFANR